MHGPTAELAALGLDQPRLRERVGQACEFPKKKLWEIVFLTLKWNTREHVIKFQTENLLVLLVQSKRRCEGCKEICLILFLKTFQSYDLMPTSIENLPSECDTTLNRFCQ